MTSVEPGSTTRGAALGWLAFAGVALCTGGSTVAVRIDSTQMAPLWGAALRLACASPIVILIAWMRKLPIPRGRALSGALIIGLLNLTMANAFSYIGLQAASPALAQLIATLSPLLTVLFAWLHRLEPLRARAILGILVCLGGLVVAVGSPTGATPAYAIAALMAASASAAESYVLASRYPGVHPIVQCAVAMPIGAALLFGVSTAAREPHLLPQTGQAGTAFVFNVVVGSVALYSLYFWLLTVWSVSRASRVFLVAPLVTAGLSAWLLGDPITIGLVVGGVLVAAGVYIGRTRDRPVTPVVRRTAAGEQPAG